MKKSTFFSLLTFALVLVLGTGYIAFSVLQWRPLADYRTITMKLDNANQLLPGSSVLLRGVNDSVEALAALSERSYAAGVLPYYLHQLDRVQGSAHFEIDDEAARDLHRRLAARISGYLVPKLVREVAGDPGKRPL